MDFFEVKLKYQTVGVEAPEKHSDTYIIEAFNFTDAESKITEIVNTYGFVNAEIKSMKPIKIGDIFENKAANDGFWYSSKVQFITLQEGGKGSTKETRTKMTVLVNADDISDATKRVREEFNNMDCESILVKKTNIVEVIRK